MSLLANSKLKLSAVALAVVLGLTGCIDDGKDGVDGVDGVDGTDGVDGVDGTAGTDGTTEGVLTRLATVPTGAEVTGAFLSDDGDLFFNIQHPSDANDEVDDLNELPFNTGTVGVLVGVDFNNLPSTLVSSPVPESDFERETVVTAIGEYQVLGQTASTLDGLLPEGLGNIYGIFSDELIVENFMPDFNGFVSTGDNEGYLFTNWELRPGGMSRLKIEKDESGSWSVEDAMMIDFDAVQGTAANCFGSVSPWGTPLTSEEWIVNSTVDSTTNASWNAPDNDADGMEALTAPDFPNPYRYGYIAEVTEATSDEPVVVKHYTIGRYEHENSVVMPDNRTVYSSQDDTGGILFRFVADADEDLSAGTLYGAKLTQDAGLTDPAVTGFDVSWVEIGSSSNAEIEAWIAEYDGIDKDDYVEGESSYMSLEEVAAWAEWVNAGRPTGTTYPTAENGGSMVTAGQPMDDRAAFIESRAAGKALGATAEWRKLEGISINHARVMEAVGGVESVADEDVTEAYMYIAIADIDNTMIDGEGDMQLSSRVKDCGGVYRATIESDYSLSRIEPVLMGGTYRSSLDGAERCDVEQLSQPDNVIVMQDGRIIIGEDGFQENNTLWMFEPPTE